jgi:hypothetical protein
MKRLWIMKNMMLVDLNDHFDVCVLCVRVFEICNFHAVRTQTPILSSAILTPEIFFQVPDRPHAVNIGVGVPHGPKFSTSMCPRAEPATVAPFVVVPEPWVMPVMTVPTTGVVEDRGTKPVTVRFVIREPSAAGY